MHIKVGGCKRYWIRSLHNNNWVWFSSATKSDLRILQRVVRTAEWIIDTTFPTLQELYLSRVSKRAGKITLTPHTQHTPSLNCYRLVDATELWAPEWPDTETVSSLRQPSHEQLTIIMVHTLFLHIHLFILHTYLVYTSIAHNIPVHTKLSIVIYLYIHLSICILLFLIYMFFLILLFIICVSVLSLLFCCTAVASVTKTNSSYE